jgi:large subunit ribosomal protein L17
MRHQVSGKKLGRKSAHRTAMFRNMAISLIQHGRITTTVQKAKELRGFAEGLVGLGKSGTLHDRRLAFDRLRNREAVHKLFSDIAPAFKNRNGGYTRVLKMSTRHGDAAQMAMIEYLREDLPVVESKGKAEKGGKAKSAKAAAPKAKKEKLAVEKAEKKAEAKKPAQAKEPKEEAQKAKKAAAPKAKKKIDKE